MRATNVLDWLEASCRSFPDKVAFSCDDGEVTYRDLQGSAQRIGTAIARSCNATRQPVAVMVGRDIESICAFMGIVYSCNFYVPVDATLPSARIEAILGQMQPAALVSIRGNHPRDGATGGVPVLDYATLLDCRPDDALLGALRRQALDADPLYAICTSGTTGTPKGVLVPQRAVLDFIPIFSGTFHFDSNETFGNQAPFDFDVSVKDIYTTLYCGASMHVIPRQCFSMPKLLAPLLDERRVTTIIWAVSALSIVAGFKAFKYRVPRRLRKVLFSGEVMPVKHLRYWREQLPEAVFVNLYGPTEITCNCMYYVVDREFADDERLPLGQAFPNERVIVLGDDDNPIRPGETGEICVTGTCVGLGYYRDPERTAAAFVQNPLTPSYREIMYRTGDLARCNDRGELVYASRKDFQIKHMGHRIELEEIEAHLNAIEGIERACCLFDERRNKIVACLAGGMQARDVVASLSRSLPKYMVPNEYRMLASLPITKNGKIDRKALGSEFLS